MPAIFLCTAQGKSNFSKSFYFKPQSENTQLEMPPRSRGRDVQLTAEGVFLVTDGEERGAGYLHRRTPRACRSTGRSYKVTEDNWPHGDSFGLRRSWPCLLPTMGRSGSCPLARLAEEPVIAQRRAQRGEAAAAVVGQVGTGET